jgi:hypothetical protein
LTTSRVYISQMSKTLRERSPLSRLSRYSTSELRGIQMQSSRNTVRPWHNMAGILRFFTLTKLSRVRASPSTYHHQVWHFKHQSVTIFELTDTICRFAYLGSKQWRHNFARRRRFHSYIARNCDFRHTAALYHRICKDKKAQSYLLL